MKKVKFIYNPYAGDNYIMDKLDEVIDVHQKHGYRVVPERLDEEHNMAAAMEDIHEGYSQILIAGGDGTVDILINYMMERDIKLPIGILPMGTANDYAKYIGIPKDISKALEKMFRLPSMKMDVGKINEKYFINVASTGLLTDVSQKTHSELKNAIGKLAYYIKGLEQIPTFRKIPVKFTSEEKTYDGDMYALLVFNGRTAGNLDFAYKSKANDGLLDVILIKASFKEIVPLLAKMLRGDHLEDPVGLLYFQTKELFIETTDELIVSDIDGERGPDFPLHIQCIQGGIEVLGVDPNHI
ncbi:YegS/Rv2252/BmrU family lipid kinase [Proteiniclasticum ruminis]|uniref:Lipid kinase, YegS/Rv2252/BmrU family n=1 Tax=Proteiniclasticum ruminis TaxID=398199 RepID=A0A1G8H6F9_9CLOT|nr:YegS/Rv2252/BmrU family lipid kinase [Proteiniclasticum ruminis]SDI02206.1 lipid kinase, YegS/Rv2252/BmrU family [Proteiniclasticum ruminis]